MLQYKNGIQLSPGEVKCLLGFTGKDPTRPHLWGANIRIESYEIVASSTNGHVGVQGTETGQHTLVLDEFFIRRPDLELLAGVCKGNHLVSVHRLGFTLLESNPETIETHELGEFEFHEPSVQMEMFPTRGLEELLGKQNETAPVMGGMFAGSYMKLFELLGNAAGGVGVRLRYPDDVCAPLKAEATEPGDSGTTWRAIIAPMRDDEKPKPEPKPADPKNPTLPNMEPTAGVARAVERFRDGCQKMADETGTTMSMEVEGKTTVIAAPGGKAATVAEQRKVDREAHVTSDLRERAKAEKAAERAAKKGGKGK